MKKTIINLKTGIVETISYTDEERTKRIAYSAIWETENIARSFEDLRKERNRRLGETDWWMLRDSVTEEQTKYRQDLRDLPTTVDISKWPDITWPTKLKYSFGTA